MKMIWLLLLMSILVVGLASANLYLTEVMHSPTQMSDTEGEWFEIYNDGDEEVELNNWKFKGKSIGNYSVEPKKYFVIARSLLDTDSDGESFESYWGNNNGIWDENYSAIQMSMVLKETDTINISDGTYTDTFTYNSSFGGTNGKTIERISPTEWREGPIDGTPGYGSFSSEEIISQELKVYLTIKNNPPQILSVNLTDDSTGTGFQVMPSYGSDKLVYVKVYLNDSDGFENIQNVSIGNQSLYLESNTSTTSCIYSGNFTMSPTDRAGDYTLEVTASDYNDITTSYVTFEYLGLIATQLNTTNVDWTLSSGESASEKIQIINQGNTAVDIEVSATDFISTSTNISLGSLEIFDDTWKTLDSPLLVNTNIQPMSSGEIQFRFVAPSTSKADNYESTLTFNSMESLQ